MKKLLQILRFVGAWVGAAVVLVVLFAIAVPENENGEVVLSGIHSALLLVVPIACGLLAAKPRKKPVSPEPPQHEHSQPEEPPRKLHAEDFLDQAMDLFFAEGVASTFLLQRKLHARYEFAVEIMDLLEEKGFLGPANNGQREILVRRVPQGNGLYAIIPFDDTTEILSEIDLMEGHAFEHWCAELLRKKGFLDVQVTPGSGDQGVDILAKKEGIKYAIQCKCYSSDLGNKPVQEVHAGKSIYGCQVGAVMTNRYFTPGGRELADATGVLLWDRDWIVVALQSTK